MLHQRDTRIVAEVSRLDAALDALVSQWLRQLDQNPTAVPTAGQSGFPIRQGDLWRFPPTSRNVVNAQLRIAQLRQNLEQRLTDSPPENPAPTPRPPMSNAESMASDAAIIQRFVDRNLASGLSPDTAYQTACEELQKICEFPWDSFHFDVESKRVLVRAETPTSTSTAHERTPSEDGKTTR